jgi:protein-S-isoprenylcysteine O-methyltransferase Ste14
MKNPGLSKRSKFQIIVQGFVVTPVALIAMLLLTAGRWDYWQAWLITGLAMVILVGELVVMRNRPEVINERLAPGKGWKTWDKLIFVFSGLLQIVTLLLGALDTGRFGWSPRFSWWVYGLCLSGYCLGQAIFLWAKHVNYYFSSVVRIQQDRGQQVCQEGPYKFVRHPGYMGFFLYTILTPLLLGSLWGLIPQGIVIILMLIRTKLEDDTLKKELPGYAEYAKEVKYRLLPGIW